jgi:hypothetical protein
LDHVGKTTTKITYAQRPPSDALFSTTLGLTIENGQKAYACDTRTKSCTSYAAGPLVDIGILFNGTEFVDASKAWVSAAVLVKDGVTLTFAHATHGGMASTCIMARKKGVTATWCVATSSGVLTYFHSGSDSFVITSFSTSPPASDFAVPHGYTTSQL